MKSCSAWRNMPGRSGVREGATLEVRSGSRGGVRVVAVAGEIDISSVAEIQVHIDAAFADGESPLVIDLTQVPFLDSSVLHTMVRAVRRAREAGGDLAIVCVDPVICRMLEVFGLSREILVCGSESEAAAALVGG